MKTSEEAIPVGMGEIRVTSRPTEVLVAHGLGSCIALCARDSVARVAGMAHIVLPQRPAAQTSDPASQAKFADQGVPSLIAAMEREGAALARIRIALVGAAQLFPGEKGTCLDIGQRNTVAVLQALQKRGLNIAAHDLGGTWGRTCQLRARDGSVLVRTIGADERELVVLRGREEGT